MTNGEVVVGSDFWLRAAVLAAAYLSVGCVSVPIGAPLAEDCSLREYPQNLDPRSELEYCERDSLTIGFFPTVGEAHQNGHATSGRELSLRWRIADYTLRPLAISAINVLSLGLPTATALALEVYEEYSVRRGPCARAVLGYCKGVRLVTQPDRRQPDGSAGRSVPQRSSSSFARPPRS